MQSIPPIEDSGDLGTLASVYCLKCRQKRENVKVLSIKPCTYNKTRKVPGQDEEIQVQSGNKKTEMAIGKCPVCKANVSSSRLKKQ